MKKILYKIKTGIDEDTLELIVLIIVIITSFCLVIGGYKLFCFIETLTYPSINDNVSIGKCGIHESYCIEKTNKSFSYSSGKSTVGCYCYFYWNLKEEFPINCIMVCDLYEKKYEKVVRELIDLIKNTTDYDKKDIFIKSLIPFYSKISNKQLIIEAIKVTVKTFKDEKINEEKIIDWIEFLKIQHPYLNTYNLFENPDEYVQIV